jgi:DNA-binding NarL/FixJ family response regulator
MVRYRILLADDHRMVAEGLSSILEPEFELVEIVQDGRALVEAAQRLRPDVILADITMPLLNGLDAVQQIQKDGCGAKVIFLTMHKDVLYAVRALRAGASGFVLKHAAITELLTALRTVLSGKNYVSPEIEALMKRLPDIPDCEADETVLLTPRQREVLQLFAEGFSAKDVAKILHISTRTAENHKAQIMNVLGVTSTVDLVRCAIRHGLIAAG